MSPDHKAYAHRSLPWIQVLLYFVFYIEPGGSGKLSDLAPPDKLGQPGTGVIKPQISWALTRIWYNSQVELAATARGRGGGGGGTRGVLGNGHTPKRGIFQN